MSFFLVLPPFCPLLMPVHPSGPKVWYCLQNSKFFCVALFSFVAFFNAGVYRVVSDVDLTWLLLFCMSSNLLLFTGVLTVLKLEVFLFWFTLPSVHPLLPCDFKWFWKISVASSLMYCLTLGSFLGSSNLLEGPWPVSFGDETNWSEISETSTTALCSSDDYSPSDSSNPTDQSSSLQVGNG